MVRQKLSIFILFIFCISSFFQVNVFSAELKDSDIIAKSAVLMDGDSGRILYGKNADAPMANASTTKIMTCILALEYGELDSIVTFSDYAASMPKVDLGARSGAKFKLRDLLYSLMLESHNDTAVAIAEHIGGDVEGFANMMNRKAREVGAMHTNFVTPNGLDDEQHYTTASDLALITRYAIQNQDFLSIIGTSSYTFSDVDGKATFTLNNKDAFLHMMDGAIGVKTGFTGNAGYCFVGAVKRNNMTLISVVLASGWPPHKTYKWKDTMKLMNYGIDHYSYRVIFDNITNFKTVEVDEGLKSQIDTEIEGHYETLISDRDIVDVRYHMNENLKAPIQKRQQVGEAVLFINGVEEKRFAVRSKQEVQKFDYRYALRYVLERLF